MEIAIASKKTSIGWLELRDGNTTSARYRIYLNGSLYRQSDDLSFLRREFDSIT